MKFGINTFLFTSPFTNNSAKLFPKFKKWGFDSVEIPVEDPSHIDPAKVQAARHVVAVGTCATSGGVFSGLYNVKGGIDRAIPVTAYIPGCPASPQAIIDGFAKVIRSLEEKG